MLLPEREKEIRELNKTPGAFSHCVEDLLAEIDRLRLSQKIDGMALAEFNEKLAIAVNGIDDFLRQVSLQWYTDQFIKDSISSTSVQNVYNFETLQRSKQAFYELNNVLKQIRGEK